MKKTNKIQSKDHEYPKQEEALSPSQIRAKMRLPAIPENHIAPPAQPKPVTRDAGMFKNRLPTITEEEPETNSDKPKI